MANYTAADIKALRERTGAGMMDVKKALDEANGDAEKAIEIIRIKGLKGATKREGRSTAEGLVAAKVDGGVGNKKIYDPRAWGKIAEKAMAERVVDATRQLGSAGHSGK